MKKLKKYIKGFTLVELIIVITILSILSTIAFISFKDYFADARDANRTVTIGNIKQSLDLQKMKTRKYPTPSESVSYTGGESEIKQGVITKEILSDMTVDPKDPSSGDYYTYSISKDGKYYQIAAQLENEISYKNLITPTFADDYESVKVEGNYRFDPSLPSLVIVPSSYTSGSGIFDPNVCFLLDGGVNTLTTCNKKKYEMSLKDFDKSLVGYWDMENTSGTLLKDLSGNGNDGECNDRNGVTSTIINCQSKLTNTGTIGQSMQFNYDGVNISNIVKTGNLILNGTGLIDYSKGFTINFISKEDVTSFTQSPLYHYNYWFHRNPITGFSSIRSYSFSGELLKNGEISCKPAHPICINDMSFLKDNLYNSTNFNLHTIIFNEKFRYYINGVSIYSFPIEKPINSKNISSFYIGGTTGSNTGFKGVIDEVKIYNRALSDEEIAQQAKIAGF